MNRRELKSKLVDVKRRIVEHDERASAARRVLEAELLQLQHLCPHKDATEYSDGGGYKGSDWSSYYWTCPDCGLRRIT